MGIEWPRYAVRDREVSQKIADRSGKGQEVWLLSYNFV